MFNQLISRQKEGRWHYSQGSDLDNNGSQLSICLISRMFSSFTYMGRDIAYTHTIFFAIEL